MSKSRPKLEELKQGMSWKGKIQIHSTFSR